MHAPNEAGQIISSGVHGQPAAATPDVPLTYAVNMQNLGPSVAENVRAELSLPEGFVLVGSIGWQQCTTSLTTVTCSASAISSGEQRACQLRAKRRTTSTCAVCGMRSRGYASVAR